MPQSILLHGPKGIGKATFAYHLARYLFQGRPDTFYISPEGPLFAQVGQGVYEGLKVLDRHAKGLEKRSRTIPVDAVRQIIQFLHTTARGGGWRVVIVDSVDELHLKAANALLKILEEPPQKTLVILIAHSLGRVLPTLKSRCRLYSKNFLDPGAMDQAMDHLIPGVDPAERALLHTYAMGCPGRMMSFMALGGRNFYVSFLEMMAGIAVGNLRPALAFLDKGLTSDAMENFHDAFNEFFSWWLGRFLTAPPQDLILIPQEANIIKKLHQKHPDYFWLEFCGHAPKMLAQIDALSLDRRAVLMALFYDMTQGKIGDQV